MRIAAALSSLLILTGCSSRTGSPGVSASPSAAVPTPASAERAPGPSPTPPAPASRVDCAGGFTDTVAMVLTQYQMAGFYGVAVVDTTNPLRPRTMCTVWPADGGQFGPSPSTVVFWVGNRIFMANLAGQATSAIGQVPAGGQVAAYSSMSRLVAYRVHTQEDGFVMHLASLGGEDRTLYTQDPMGGHGGPGMDFGPFRVTGFSPDGTELLDYMLFRPPASPGGNLLVFKADGTRLLQESFGVGLWGSTGSVLYFSVFTRQPAFEIDSLDSNGARHVVTPSVGGFYWPRLAPDGASIVYNAPGGSDTSSAASSARHSNDCGGFPGIWQIDVRSGKESRVSNTLSAIPVYVGQTAIWSEEEQTQSGFCGLGGPTVPDGVVVSHDVRTGSDAVVNLDLIKTGSLTMASIVLDIIDTHLPG